jgi:hypothetical protein
MLGTSCFLVTYLHPSCHLPTGRFNNDLVDVIRVQRSTSCEPAEATPVNLVEPPRLCEF